MKKLSSLLLAGGLAFATTGCEEFLTPDPETFVSSANYYTQPQHFEQAVVGLYANLRGLYNADYRELTDFRSDLVTLQYNIGVPGFTFVIDEFTESDVDGNVNGQYNDIFNMIFDANVVLTRIDGVTFADQAQKDRLIAEARFLRALAYWQGLQFFGIGDGWPANPGQVLAMPIITTEVTGPTQAFEIERSSVQDVYSFIVAELEAAKPGLPVKGSSGATGNNLGRITRGAAAFLLGATYQLNTASNAEQEKAIAQFAELSANYGLITSGAAGNNAFRQVFNPANKNNNESILEIQYNGAATVTNNALFQNLIGGMAPLNSAGGGNAGNPDRVSIWGNAGGGGYMPTPNHILSFAGADPSDPAMPFDLRYEGGYGAFCPGSGISGVLGVADVLVSGQSGNEAWPDINIESLRDPVTHEVRSDCIAYFTKWRWEDQTPLSGRDNNNWIVFRYADALLRRAESLVRVGRAGEAKQFVDQVRARAGLPALAGNPTLDLILEERAKELGGEGHRWFDLKRYGVAEEVIDAHGDFLRARNNSAAIRARTIEEDAYTLGVDNFRARYPVRPRDVTLSGGLIVQNPGW